ncbi:hypothetical protein OSB04_029091 [Centaurea solstitialis]|uniref:Purple acid phosphatase C-terminal domain-containing protein n=1 Tax=Centaurea solstitialis TaxID=347529 RepID=A0AA38W8D3_9ASTR|nr:hypothetical protein OSB04_029091 [Centaurea solstitialis]
MVIKKRPFVIVNQILYTTFFQARVYDNHDDPCGPVHITIGDGGNRQGLANKYIEPRPSISLYREASFGHGRLRMMNETHAHWSWHCNDDSVAFVADDVWLKGLNSLCSQKIRPKLAQHDEL